MRAGAERLHLVANCDITKSWRINARLDARLAIIHLNILDQKQLNMTAPFYDVISKHSQSILARKNKRAKHSKMHPKFWLNS